MKEIFTNLEKAIRENDEDLFRAHWNAEAFENNTVGGSGLAGKRVFEQGARQKWYPKADFDRAERIGNVEIIPASIWNWEKERTLDHVYFAVETEARKVIGGGENQEEVKQLAERFNAGKALIARR